MVIIAGVVDYAKRSSGTSRGPYLSTLPLAMWVERQLLRLDPHYHKGGRNSNTAVTVAQRLGMTVSAQSATRVFCRWHGEQPFIPLKKVEDLLTNSDLLLLDIWPVADDEIRTENESVVYTDDE